TKDLDTYDSDCDDLSNAQAVLMTNISNYGSDVILEVPQSETYLNDMENQSVLAMQDFEQPPAVDSTDNEIHSDSNIILKPSDALLVKIKAPKELSKIRLVNEILKKLKFHLAKFDSVGIVEQAKAKQHLDNTLDFAFKHAQKIQELLVYVRDTCPNAINHSAKRLVSYLKTRSRKLGLKCFTSNCGSKPTGYPDCSLVSGLWMFETHDRELLSDHEIYNGTEFVNQILREFYKNIGISYQTSVARTPQQNDIVERRNQTLVEAAHTIDDWDHLFQPMFDEYFNPPTIAVSPVPVAATPRAVDLANSYVSTSIDQDAPST
nr:integrase, catalytic region, zinc finger, CCHC-type, peptidase aspartic, catalytic [Tanacetum cinerariifolium]